MPGCGPVPKSKFALGSGAEYRIGRVVVPLEKARKSRSKIRERLRYKTESASHEVERDDPRADIPQLTQQVLRDRKCLEFVRVYFQQKDRPQTLERWSRTSLRRSQLAYAGQVILGKCVLLPSAE